MYYYYRNRKAIRRCFVIKAESLQKTNYIYQNIYRDNSILTGESLDVVPTNGDFKEVAAKLQSIENIEKLFKQSNFIQNNKEGREALDNFISRIQNLPADANIINELVASGISLDKIDLSMLAEAVKISDDYRKIAPKEDWGVFSDKTLKAINKNLDIIEPSKSLGEGAILNLIKNNAALSPENLLVYKNTGAPAGSHNFDNIDSEIKKLFNQQGIEESNLDIARKFVDSGIEINAENIEKYKFLKTLDIDKNIVASETARAIWNNEKPTGIDLFWLDKTAKLFKSNVEASKKMNHIQTNSIQSLIDNGKDITLMGLFNASEGTGSNTAEGISQEAIEFKKIIAEAQLKLSTEACYRLAGKNIDINFMPVKNLLSQLNTMLYEKNLKIMGTEAAAENINAMSETFNNVEGLKYITPPVYKDIALKAVDFNLRAINKSILENYGASQTKPSTKYGDKITAKEMSGFLNGLGYTDSEANQSAFKILFKNKMDITPENLDKIKLIEHKLNFLKDWLKPNIAAQMLKENIDPSQLNIDEMVEYIEKFNEAFGVTHTGTIEESLMKFEKDNNRGGLYSIYRMLHTISKNDYKAIGFLVQGGSELTLNNLFEASKYINSKKRFEYSIDDGFGELERLSAPEKNIIGSIRKAISTEMASP
ncbi:MAG: DUF6240 domain-containing protein, partial [Clostridiales bacterium]|nr:DUF6240 domain-containing protein [Clostridiales bacterium]